MSSLMPDEGAPLACSVEVTDERLTVRLSDGRSIAAPLVWFPRLLHGSSSERNKWELIGGGSGIHWPDLDEDVSVEALLLGRRSRESPQSLQKWLDARHSHVTA